MKSLLICHISSVHPGDDVRIFHKECRTLAEFKGWKVHLVGNRPLNVDDSGVIFHALPDAPGQGRLKRMMFRTVQAYRVGRAIDADIYHIHDPELLPWGLLLKIAGKKVIYDAHEDLPRDILTKPWIPRALRMAVAALTERVENFVARRLDCVVAATPFIRDRFLKVGVRAVDINNYPKLGELCVAESIQPNRSRTVCFTGAISEERGAYQMVEAMRGGNLTLQLAGTYSPSGLRAALMKLPGWENVIELGQVKRSRLAVIFASSFAGVVLFHPVPNNVNAQPNKLFEYMSAGLPVIASDFPLWRQIVDSVGCGLCVNPLDPVGIAEAMTWLADHPDDARAMGHRGMIAVREQFNWEFEALRLKELYLEVADR